MEKVGKPQSSDYPAEVTAFTPQPTGNDPEPTKATFCHYKSTDHSLSRETDPQ